MTADETTGPTNASSDPYKAGQTPVSPPEIPSNEPEPVILEERVVKIADAKPKSPPPTSPKPALVPTPAPTPIPTPPPLAAPAPAPIPAEPKPIPTIVVPNPDPNFKPHLAPDPLGTPASVPTPTPKPMPAPKPPAAQSSTDVETDIARILGTVKLPERRDFKAAGDSKPAPAPVSVASPEVKAPAAAQATPGTVSEESATSVVTPLRTLKDDLQTIVRDQKISLVHAVSLEEEKKQGQEHIQVEQKEIRARRSHRTTFILTASGVLILLGIGALFGVYYVAQEQAAIPSAPQSSILFAEQTASLSLDNQSAGNLKDQLSELRTKQIGSLGSILRIIPTMTATSSSGQSQQIPVTLQQFFTSLGINPPQELMSSIGPSFFFGFHVVDTNAPLFVIPVTSYDRAFAGMLAWEPTIDADLSPVFTSVSPTVEVNGLPQERTFEDEVLRNYDVRELQDDQGNVVLFYSFPTPNILVIAQSPYSFTEILSRLQAAREL